MILKLKKNIRKSKKRPRKFMNKRRKNMKLNMALFKENQKKVLKSRIVTMKIIKKIRNQPKNNDQFI